MKHNNDNNCKGLSFADCELTILRTSVDKAEKKMKQQIVDSEEIKHMIEIVEMFIVKKKAICYGGTAINNILPKNMQFYNKKIDLPDYDFYSPNALEDAKELADIYNKNGFDYVETKTGQHHGTYKVYVNFIPIADVTFLPNEIYNALIKDTIKINGILYAPPNYLRMAMYLELSKPAGDISRWEKVYKRLTLLNKYYGITKLNCNNIKFQRPGENMNYNISSKVYSIIKDTLINQGVVFFGGYALFLYSKYTPSKKKKINDIPDFDVIAKNAKEVAIILKERLEEENIKEVSIKTYSPIGEIIPEHYELKVGVDIVVFIYSPQGCHSYNTIKINKKIIKVASIETMLTFYLAFLYTSKKYYNNFLDRNLCIANYLFDLQRKNRLNKKGILKRFSISCYGHQQTLAELRAEKYQKYIELKNTKNKKEYDEWFLNYTPTNNSKRKKKNVINKPTTKSKKNKTTTKSKKNKTTTKSKKNKTKRKKNTNKKIFAMY